MKRFFKLLFCLFLLSPLAFADGMISQVNGSASNQNTGITAFVCPMSASSQKAWNTTESNMRCVMPVAGTFSNLNVTLSGASGTGSRQFTIFVNGAAPANSLDTTITNGTSNADNTHTVTVAAGDVISLRQITTGTLNSVSIAWGMRFTAATLNSQPLVVGPGANGVASGGTKFTGLMGDRSPGVTTESLVTQVMPTGGTISGLYAITKTAPGATFSVSFTLKVNGSPTALTTTIADLATSNQDLVNSVAVVAGDRVVISIDASDLNTTVLISTGLIFTPTIAAESILLSGTSAQQAQNTTRFLSPSGMSFGSTTEAPTQQLLMAGTLKKFYVYTDAVIGGAAQTAISTLNIGTTPQTLTCTIASGAQSCNNTVNSYVASTGNLMSLSFALSATTGSISSGYGMVMEMTQPTPTPTATSTPAAVGGSAVLNRLLKKRRRG